MLEVKIDLLPFGKEDGRRTIENLYIWNIGCIGENEQGKLCEYMAAKMDPRTEGKMAQGVPVKVQHYREDGAWVLVDKVLSELQGQAL